MGIRISCSNCGGAFVAKDELRGRSVACPKCRQTLQVDGAPTQQATAAKTSPSASAAPGSRKAQPRLDAPLERVLRHADLLSLSERQGFYLVASGLVWIGILSMFFEDMKLGLIVVMVLSIVASIGIGLWAAVRPLPNGLLLLSLGSLVPGALLLLVALPAFLISVGVALIAIAMSLWSLFCGLRFWKAFRKFSRERDELAAAYRDGYRAVVDPAFRLVTAMRVLKRSDPARFSATVYIEGEGIKSIFLVTAHELIIVAVKPHLRDESRQVWVVGKQSNVVRFGQPGMLHTDCIASSSSGEVGFSAANAHVNTLKSWLAGSGVAADSHLTSKYQEFRSAVQGCQAATSSPPGP